jgi:hypothetical protein
MGEDAGEHRPPLCQSRRAGRHSTTDGGTATAYHVGGEGPGGVGPAGGVGE